MHDIALETLQRFHFVHFMKLLHLRIGHLEEAARDLSVAVEMTKQNEAKTMLYQKLVSLKQFHMCGFIFSNYHKCFFVITGSYLFIVWPNRKGTKLDTKAQVSSGINGCE